MKMTFQGIPLFFFFEFSFIKNLYIWFAPNLSSTFERCIYISKSNFSISANKQTVAKTQLYFQPLYCDPNSFISMLTELPATLSIWYGIKTILKNLYIFLFYFSHETRKAFHKYKLYYKTDRSGQIIHLWNK